MKRTIKNLLVLVLALVMILSLASCGNDKKTLDDTEVSSSAVADDKTEKDTEAVESSAQQPKEESEETDSSTQKPDDEKKEQVEPEKSPAPAPVPQEEAPAPAPTPEETTPSEPEPLKEEEPPVEDEVETPAPVDLKSVAMSYKGKSAASLIQAIGQPSGKSYASSCIGDGEDGEWYYNGFTVYTYRDTDGSERVEDVF